MKLLQDKVAIVTGAASPRGIGAATAALFVEHGARVVVLDLDAAAAVEAAARLGPEHLGLACDVRVEPACRAAVAATLARFGAVDVLVNNAGVSQRAGLLESSATDFDLVMDTSARGSFNMSRAVAPHFRQRRTGAIVCIGSLAGQRGGGILGGPHYAAAKGAVHSLAKAMARELGPHGTRVNAVAPGLAQTDLLLGKMDEQGQREVAAMTVLGRIAAPLDIAKACLFLASDLASYVTGVVLDVNGGLHIH